MEEGGGEPVRSLVSGPATTYVKLNVGGALFHTTIGTLTRADSMLRAMFSGRMEVLRDSDGWVLIDRSGKHFGLLLNWLRDGDVPLPDCRQEVEEILTEARYYLLQELVSACQSWLEATRSVEKEPIGVCRIPIISTKAEAEKMIASTHWPTIKLLINRHNNKYSYTTQSDDNILKNLELFDRMALKFHDRILFVKDVGSESSEVCQWKFYGKGILKAEVCCTSIVYATDKKQTKVEFPDSKIYDEAMSILRFEDRGLCRRPSTVSLCRLPFAFVSTAMRTEEGGNIEDFSHKLVAKIPLHCPSLEELAQVLQSGLSSSYSECSVSVVSCPDLSSAPFFLASKGLGSPSKARIADVGGLGNLVPVFNSRKKYSLARIVETCELDGGFVIGPSAGPLPHAHRLHCSRVSQMVSNAIVRPLSSTQSHSEPPRKRERKETRNMEFALLANLLITDGEEEQPTLRVHARGRRTDVNFAESLRLALARAFPQQLVSMAGVFALRAGRAQIHVMSTSEYPREPVSHPSEIQNWYQYFRIAASPLNPLTFATVFHSMDPVRVEHTHCYSEKGDGSHFLIDTTPEEADYEGFFLPARHLYRIDEVFNSSHGQHILPPSHSLLHFA